MNNIIVNDEEIIGKLEYIYKYFKEEIKKQLDDNNLSMEEIKQNFDEIFLILIEIEEKEQDNYDEIFKVVYNPMGAYQYKVLKEID